MKVVLQREDYEKILAYAKKELPDEACGLIAGTDEGELREIKKVYLLTNTDHSNEHFTLDPKEQLSAVQDMRKLGLKPLGNWHSHPESPARQSEEDKRLSFDKTASYMILSLQDKEAPVMKSFHFEDGVSKEEELTIR
ncbi:MAG: M67 family metallopeptidase [Lachnospiraceae bacterium]|nr:M67 family metallopeptidase [Lachnospiraceae bacterium]